MARERGWLARSCDLCCFSPLGFDFVLSEVQNKTLIPVVDKDLLKLHTVASNA